MEGHEYKDPNEKETEEAALAEVVKTIENYIGNKQYQDTRPIFEKFLEVAHQYDGARTKNWCTLWTDMCDWGREKGLLTQEESGYLWMFMK